MVVVDGFFSLLPSLAKAWLLFLAPRRCAVRVCVMRSWLASIGWQGVARVASGGGDAAAQGDRMEAAAPPRSLLLLPAKKNGWGGGADRGEQQHTTLGKGHRPA